MRRIRETKDRSNDVGDSQNIVFEKSYKNWTKQLDFGKNVLFRILFIKKIFDIEASGFYIRRTTTKKHGNSH